MATRNTQRIRLKGVVAFYIFVLVSLLSFCIITINLSKVRRAEDFSSVEQYFLHAGNYYLIFERLEDKYNHDYYEGKRESKLPNEKDNNILRRIIDSSESAFDTLTKIFYSEAISQPTAESVGTRQRLNITEWNKQPSSWGGLFTEDRELLSDLYFNASSIFEYGLGESTYVAAHTGVPRYAGVDSDVNWVSTARDTVVANLSGDNFRFYFADIGPTLQWGKPADQNLAKIAYNYQVAPLVSELQPFDVYMIDGRYRVSCACVSFLHALKYANNENRGGIDFVRKNVRIAIHDATARENSFGRYGQLQKIADVVGKARELWVYRLKKGISEQDVYNLWKSNTKIQFRRRRRLIEDIEGVSSKFDHIRYETYSKATEVRDSPTDNLRITSKDQPSNKYNVKDSFDFKDDNILKELYANSSSVFEFGVGRSTNLAVQSDISRYAGSDSMAKSLFNARNLTLNCNLDHFRFFFSDIGGTNRDGTAVDESSQKISYNYAFAPLVVESEAFDLYAIDGRRYGLLCICISFLHAIKYNANVEKVAVVVYGKSFDSEIQSFAYSISNSTQGQGHFSIYRLDANKGEREIVSALIEHGYLPL